MKSVENLAARGDESPKYYAHIFSIFILGSLEGKLALQSVSLEDTNIHAMNNITAGKAIYAPCQPEFNTKTKINS